MMGPRSSSCEGRWKKSLGCRIDGTYAHSSFSQMNSATTDSTCPELYIILTMPCHCGIRVQVFPNGTRAASLVPGMRPRVAQDMSAPRNDSAVQSSSSGFFCTHVSAVRMNSAGGTCDGSAFANSPDIESRTWRMVAVFCFTTSTLVPGLLLRALRTRSVRLNLVPFSSLPQHPTQGVRQCAAAA